MKRFTLRVGNHCLPFTESDMHAIQSALTEAARHPGKHAFRASPSGNVSAVLHDTGPEASGHKRAAVQPLPGVTRMTDRNRQLTDC